MTICFSFFVLWKKKKKKKKNSDISPKFCWNTGEIALEFHLKDSEKLVIIPVVFA